MKKFINGLRFDTKKAELIADYEYGHQGDHGWLYEAIYRTARGNWFLAGNGGARSKYGERVDQNTYGAGEALIPLSADEALAWLERHGETDAIEAYFSDKISDA